MLHPAPTTRIDPQLARGVIDAVREPTATKPVHAELRLHNSDYVLHLAPTSNGFPSGLAGRVPAKVIGRVRANARRVDVCRTGGKYVDPVVGTPRRVQGRVIANTGGVLVVDAGAPFTLRLTAPGQKAEQFELGAMITCEIAPGATLEITG